MGWRRDKASRQRLREVAERLGLRRVPNLGGCPTTQAVNDLLVRFVEGVREHAPIGRLADSDFDWAAPEDF